MAEQCPLCNRVHPAPPPPGRTPTVHEDAYGAQREHHADGSMHPMGSWGSIQRRRMAAWCADHARATPTPASPTNPAPVPTSGAGSTVAKEP